MTTVSLTISEVLDIALKSYYAGKLAEAEQLCLKILSADPDSAAALNLLAVIHTSLGRNDAALACYDRALTLRPDFIQALSNRGAVLKQMRRYDDALDPRHQPRRDDMRGDLAPGCQSMTVQSAAHLR